MDPTEVHRQLLDPDCYPDHTTTVSFRETHISRVYLTDRYAYKFKKPLNLGFLDFSTLARRQFFCFEELRLNRRFAPDTYLDMVELRDWRGRLRLGNRGKLIDYAVRMQRLPEERMLSHLLDCDDPALPVEIERLAGHLVNLLAQATPCLDEESPETVRGKICGNLHQTESAIGVSLSARAHAVMAAHMESELQRLTPLIAQRSAQGYVRDGHGDLHAANICMTDPVRVYDCIEFCRGFRVADVAADLAFLLMDLDFRGRRDLARIFFDSYQRQTRDPDLHRLLPLYKSYRGWVRGKVSTLLATEGEVAAPLREQALVNAQRYFNLALGYQVAPALILTSGLMGVGKSTLAKALAVATGATLLRSDVIRKELAGFAADRPCVDPFASGLYTAEATTRTYLELRKRAAAALAEGAPVIVDASFAAQTLRREFIAMAAGMKLPTLLLHLRCEPAIAMTRLDDRQRQGTDPSDGRRGIYPQQADAFEPFSEELPLLEIDSSHPVDYNVQKAVCQLLQPFLQS